jgi:predicted ArsR family transcriptional regulator
MGAGGQQEEGNLADVLALLRYRPCTIDDIAHGLDMHPNHVIKHVSRLIEDDEVRTELREGETYYVKTEAEV